MPKVGVRALARWKEVYTGVGLVPRQGEEGLLPVSEQGVERNFLLEEAGSHYLNQVIKETASVMSQIKITCGFIDATKRTQHQIFLIFLHNQYLVMSKYQTSLSRGTATK